MVKNLFVLVMVLALFTGCATSTSNGSQPTVSSDTSLGIPKSKIKNFTVSISKSGAVHQSEAYVLTKNELQKELIDTLKRYYPQAKINFEESMKEGVAINLRVVDFSYVSGAARFLGGVMSGDARLGVNIKVRDVKNDKMLLSENFATTSSKWSGIFGATTSRQIESVVNYIVENLNKTEI